MQNYDSRGTNALLPYHAFDMGRGKADVVYDSRFHNITAGAAIGQEEALLLGTRYECPDGRMWVYVQMTGAAAPLGAVLQAAAIVGEDTVSSAADLLSITGGGVDTAWTAGAFAGDYVYVDDGTGEGQCRRILNNSATALFLDRPLTTALAIADSDITIFRPFHMRLALAAITTPVSGIASVLNPNAGTGPGTNAIDQNSYGWIQVRGFCEHILLDNTATIAGGGLVVDDGVAGTARDVGAGAAWPDQYVFGNAMIANVSTTAPGYLTGCLLG